MGKKNKHRQEDARHRGHAETPPVEALDHEDYEAQMTLLQIELVKLQRHVIHAGKRILVILEGRDAAGKDGSIKRIVECLSPRETRVVALGKPSERQQGAWYFQRYVAHLPVAGELVLFNRSWYNRAGVERVMGFCSHDEYEDFMQAAPKLEGILVDSGVQLFKYYLDIDKKEQIQRLSDRKRDPLKSWKNSPIDAVAVKHWKDYSEARDAMLLGTHTEAAPWHIVLGNDKRMARLNLIRDLLWRLDYPSRNAKLVQPDKRLVFTFTPDCLTSALLAR